MNKHKKSWAYSRRRTGNELAAVATMSLTEFLKPTKHDMWSGAYSSGASSYFFFVLFLYSSAGTQTRCDIASARDYS